METKIYEVLRNKGDFILTTEPNSSARNALKTMEDQNVGSILVMDGDELVGIFSERDYIRRIVLKEGPTGDTPIREVMSSKVVVAENDDTVEECMAVMTSKRIRHLPVYEDGVLVGIVSIGDLVKKVSEKAKTRVQYLEQYIRGEYPA